MFNPVIQKLNQSTRQKAIENADEVEWQALKHGSSIIEYGIADEIISGELFDEAELVDQDEVGSIATIPAWSTRSETEESETAAIAEEIERRKLILGSEYPFEVKGSQITYQPSRKKLYEFCLAISMSSSLTKKPFNELPQAFEATATELLVTWMGPGTKGWQTGYPGRIKTGLPASTPELWKIINQETGEWEWQPGSDIPDGAEDDQKDLGMDVLVWKSIDDARTHALFLAGQCACGRDALSGNGKSADLKASWLAEWFRTQSKVNFIPCLLLPRCLGGAATEIRAKSGTLFFDRIRLVLIANSTDNPSNLSQFNQRYTELVELVKNDQN